MNKITISQNLRITISAIKQNRKAQDDFHSSNDGRNKKAVLAAHIYLKATSGASIYDKVWLQC